MCPGKGSCWQWCHLSRGAKGKPLPSLLLPTLESPNPALPNTQLGLRRQGPQVGGGSPARKGSLSGSCPPTCPWPGAGQRRPHQAAASTRQCGEWGPRKGSTAVLSGPSSEPCVQERPSASSFPGQAAWSNSRRHSLNPSQGPQCINPEKPGEVSRAIGFRICIPSPWGTPGGWPAWPMAEQGQLLSQAALLTCHHTRHCGGAKATAPTRGDVGRVSRERRAHCFAPCEGRKRRRVC